MLKEIELIIVGKITNTMIYNLVNDLNTIQKEFKFDFNEKIIEMPSMFLEKQTIETDLLEKYLIKRTLNYKPNSYKIFICDFKFEEDLFSSYGSSIGIISIYYWKHFGTWEIKDRICFTIVDIIANALIEIKFHYDNRGCPSDYCAYGEMNKGIEIADYCPECKKEINNAIRKGRISIRNYVAILKILDYIGKRKLSFVLMPFNEKFNGVYLGAIEPTLIRNGFIPQRSDQIFQDKEIMNIIHENIIRAELIIADLSGKNPNVFYELGYAHAENKNAILLTQSLEDVPFDLRHWQCLKYENTVNGLANLSIQLEKYLNVY